MRESVYDLKSEGVDFMTEESVKSDDDIKQVDVKAGGDERTMEEILSSIREIIDEETERSERDLDATAAKHTANSKNLASPKVDGTAEDDSDLAAQAQILSELEEILDLTEMVSDDGSIVSLKADDAAKADSETVVEGVNEEAEKAETQDENEATPDPIEAEAIASDDSEEREPEIMAAKKEEAIEETPKEEAKAEEAPKAEEVKAEENPAPVVEKAETAPQPSEPLMSEVAAESSKAAFEVLNKAMHKAPKPQGVADQTMDQFMRSVMTPMLKEWLDDHLPQVVERLVNREIKKIADQAATEV